MTTRQISLCVAMTSLLTALPATAENSPASVAPPSFFATQADWSGFYVGAHTGGFVDGQQGRLFRSGPSGPGGGGGGGAADGGVGGAGGAGANASRGFGNLVTGATTYQGLHGGYNLQLGGVVFGVEGDINGLGRIDDVLGSVRARFGYATGPVLLYGTAGAAFQSYSGGPFGGFVVGNGGGNGGNGGAGILLGPGGPGGPGGTGGGSSLISGVAGSRSGFVGGGGVEVKLSPLVSVGVEALAYRFGDQSFSLALPRDTLALNGRLNFHLGDPRAPTAPGPIASWAGGYGGAHIGGVYNLSQAIVGDVSLTNGNPGGAGGNGAAGGGGGGGGGGSGAVAFASLQRYTSFIGGVHLGYNWQSANLVYGGEGDIDFSPDRTHTFLGSVRGRLGWANDAYLLYGTVGAAFNRNEAVRAVFAGNGGNGANGASAAAGAAGGAGGLGGLALAVRADDTRVGFAVGGGFETKVTNRVSLGVEGLYYDFGRSAPTPVFGGAPGGALSRDDALVLRTRLTIGLQP